MRKWRVCNANNLGYLVRIDPGVPREKLLMFQRRVQKVKKSQAQGSEILGGFQQWTCDRGVPSAHGTRLRRHR